MIETCVETTKDNIGVNSAAGSGKTHLICTQAARLAARGERSIGLTLNRDAAQELRDRGFEGARTFHSLGGKAWHKAHANESQLVHEKEDESDAAEEAAEDADELDAEEAPTEQSAKEAKDVPKKTKMLLRELYPDVQGRNSYVKCVEVNLFEPFVSSMLTYAKMGAVGIDGGPDNDDATWSALEREFDASSLIERVLMADKPDKSKLNQAQFAEATQKWPTPVSRTEAGLRMAREAFAASITIARHKRWRIEHLGRSIDKLVSRKRNGAVAKEYTLPCLDFDDILYMPMLEGLPLDPGPGKYERATGPLRWVFADEAQDTATIRQLMLKRLAGSHARVFAVGDDMQALYGYAGVDPHALTNLFERFDMKVFDLPVCRRCPVSHIKLANEVKNKNKSPKADVKPMPNAPEGTIAEDADFISHPLLSTTLATSSGAQGTGEAPKQPEKAIIARRNAPLLACLYALAARGISCEMLGKQPLSKRLIGVINEIKPSDLGSLESGLDAYVRRHKERKAAEGGESEYTHEDLATCLRTIIDELDRRQQQQMRQRMDRGSGDSGKEALEKVKKEILSIFGSTQQVQPPDKRQLRVVQLGTVHKAKGLGWKWVYWLQPDDIPLDFVIKAGGWRATQERNAKYVALTRSFMHLIKLRHIDPQETGLRRGIEELFPPTAGAGPSSGMGSAHDEARYAWEQAHPFEWYRQERASRQRQRQQQAREEAEEDENAMTVAQACELLGLPPPPAPLDRDAMLTAFRLVVRNCHPDRRSQHNLSEEEATARTQAVNEAKAVLEREFMAEQDGE